VFILSCSVAGAFGQIAPLKVTVNRVTGPEHPKTGFSNRVTFKHETHLHIIVENTTGRALEGIETSWVYVLDHVPVMKQHGNVKMNEIGTGFVTGNKTIALRPAGRMEFDTESVELTRERSESGVLNEQTMRGYQFRVAVQGKTVFEETKPPSIEKLVVEFLQEQGKEAGSDVP
jgi:hypothetical protein